MRVGFVSIVGAPNVGKSTLVNRLVGIKLSGISPKPQTTRHAILGVITRKDFQIALLDTPGVLAKKDNLMHLLMDKATWRSVGEADLVLMMADPKPPGQRDLMIIDKLKELGKPSVLAINKIDTVRKLELLPIMDAYSKLFPFEEIVPISALTGDGVEELLEEVARRLPEGEPLFPEDQVTDRPMRFIASEIIREKIFLVFRQEVPYQVAVEIEEFREDSDSLEIKATIYVERESQKPIILGKGGSRIKKVGIMAREELELLLGRRVDLRLWVKVKPGWRKDAAFLKRLGYRL